MSMAVRGSVACQQRWLTVPLLLSVLAAVITAQEPAERFVQVDGHRMRVKTAGVAHARDGVPAVVFEAGMRSPLDAWLGVPPAVAAFAPVVAYDRMGNGQSESDGQPPTPPHVARRLHALLAQLGLAPPYVLVGHSWGGLLIRNFAALYPGEVAGLVYVDPTDARSEEQSMAYYKARGFSEDQVPAIRAARQQTFSPPPGTEMAVAMDLERTHFAALRALPPPPDVPVAVLMAVKYDPSPWAGEPCQPRECYDRWVQLRTGWLMPLVQASSNGTLTIATNSGHNMQRDDPALVVSAIRRVVTVAQKPR